MNYHDLKTKAKDLRVNPMVSEGAKAGLKIAIANLERARDHLNGISHQLQAVTSQVMHCLDDATPDGNALPHLVDHHAFAARHYSKGLTWCGMIGYRQAVKEVHKAIASAELARAQHFADLKAMHNKESI